MKRISISKIEEALVRSGVPADAVPLVAVTVWDALFSGKDKVASTVVLAALDEAKRKGAFLSYFWLGKQVGMNPNYFPTLRSKPRTMPYETALRACVLAGVDLEEVLRSAG